MPDGVLPPMVVAVFAKTTPRFSYCILYNWYVTAIWTTIPKRRISKEIEDFGNENLSVYLSITYHIK